MKFNFWCWLTGHSPYLIEGMFTDWEVVPDKTATPQFLITMYDPPRMDERPKLICLSCGKELKK